METLRRLFTPRNTILALVVLLLVSMAMGLYFYRKATVDSKSNADQERQQVANEIGKLIVLPENEIPTLATVSDPAKLADQAFFAHAQKGDQVLIYMQAHKAILYRPSVHKIIEVAPVNGGGNINTETP